MIRQAADENLLVAKLVESFVHGTPAKSLRDFRCTGKHSSTTRLVFHTTTARPLELPVSFTLDSDIKDRVRAATDIVDLLGSYMELRRQGRGFVALCPWHADRRPSLQINVEKQIWKCWVCDIGGDVFNFVMQREGITFREALTFLAERAGVQLPTMRSPDQVRQATDEKQSMLKALQWAGEQYHRALLESSEAEVAREYLRERGLSEESIRVFQLGFTPDRWSFLTDKCQAAGHSHKVLEAADLATKSDRGSYYDRFRGRIMFPICDAQKRVVAFGGRILPCVPDAAKYINSRETRLFTKHQVLYGLDHARDAIVHNKEVIVMEGYTDVIIAHQFGLKNAVAVLGTALGAAHLKMLRHLCNRVILLLDGDAAGQKRSDEVLELFLNAQMDVRVLSLPDDLDPADYLLQRGADSLLQMIAQAADGLEFKMRRVCSGFDPLLETHRANQAIEQMLALLAKVPKSNLISDEAFRLRQDQILARLSRQFAVAETTLRDRLSSLRRSAPRVRADHSHSDVPPPKMVRPGDLSPLERELLELMIISPELAPMALERILPDWLQNASARAMLDAYQLLESQGVDLQFNSVLNALEDASLKSLLVILFDQAQVKQQYVKESPENRLRVLTQRMGEQQEQMRRQQQELELGSERLDESEKLSLLNEMIRQARQRQGVQIPPEESATLNQ